MEKLRFKVAPNTPEIEEAEFIFDKLPWQQFLDLPVVDVGSHYGGFSANFLNAGFKVESFEPNPDNYQKQSLNLQEFLTRNQLTIHQIAASNREGEAQMYLASADTLHSLCPEWRTIAFPEYFNTDNQMSVQCRKLGKFLRERGYSSLFFVKVDTEGHEFEAISGLIDDGENSIIPPVLMFEVNKRFHGKIAEVLSLLLMKGYEKFIWWIKFSQKVWYHAVHSDNTIPNLDHIEGYYYGNIIALRPPLSNFITSGSNQQNIEGLEEIGHPKFEILWEKMQAEYTSLNNDLMANGYTNLESKYVHPSWMNAKEQIRNILSGQPNPKFLDEPVITGKMVRHGFTVSQEYEVTSLKCCTSKQVKKLIDSFKDTDFGYLPKECKEFNCSTNTLGHLYYAANALVRFRNGLPKMIMEFGGGYGNLARIFKVLCPEVTIFIIDLPELIAFQYLFLNSTLPKVETIVHHVPPKKIHEGAVHLIPAFFLEKLTLDADFFISTFGLSETPQTVQEMVAKKHFFNSSVAYIAGQLEGAPTENGWFSHKFIFDSIRNHYQIVDCRPFHVFQHGVTLYEISGINLPTLQHD